MENRSKTGGEVPSGKRWRLAVLTLAALAFWPMSPMGAASRPAQVEQERTELLKNQWDPAKLYATLTSHDPEASENLYRAAFAAGPAIIPKIGDDRRPGRERRAVKMLARFGVVGRQRGVELCRVPLTLPQRGPFLLDLLPP